MACTKVETLLLPLPLHKSEIHWQREGTATLQRNCGPSAEVLHTSTPGLLTTVPAYRCIGRQMGNCNCITRGQGEQYNPETQAQRAELEGVFREMDYNGDDSLNWGELNAVFTGMPPSNLELPKLKSWMVRHALNERMVVEFRGCKKESELMRVYNANPDMHPESAAQMMDRLDSNDDNVVSIDEWVDGMFKRYMKRGGIPSQGRFNQDVKRWRVEIQAFKARRESHFQEDKAEQQKKCADPNKYCADPNHCEEEKKCNGKRNGLARVYTRAGGSTAYVPGRSV